MASNRRKHPRAKPGPRSTVLCTPGDGAGPDPSLCTRIVDISARGACIVTGTRLPPGTGIQVEISLPDAGGKFATKAVVRWSQSTPGEAGGATHLAGLEFEKAMEGVAVREGETPVLAVFQTLRVAVAQLRLYPKDSPQVLKVVTDTYNAVHSFVEGAGMFTVSRTPRGLLVNGAPLPALGHVKDSLEAAMIALLAEVQIKSISVKKGLTIEELITFLHALTRKFWDVKDGKEINRRLRDERVFQISVDEVTYVAVGEGDLVIEDAAGKLEGGQTEAAKLLASLDQMIESADRQGLGAEGRLQIMKHLLQKDPNLLKQAGGASAPAEADESGRITFEEAKEALGELARLRDEAPPALHRSIRKVSHVLVDAFRSHPQLHAAMDALLSEEAMPGLAKEAGAEPAAPAAVSKARSVMDLREDAQIQALAQEGAGLIEELTALDEGDLIRSLLNTLTAFVGDKQPRRRLAAARAIAGLQRALERNATEDMLKDLEGATRTCLEAEREPNTYHALADLIVFLADLRIRRGALERGAEFLDLLGRHYKIRESSFPQRGELAYIALERAASGTGFGGLTERIRQGDAAATRILEALDAAATRFLVDEIRSAENAARRIYFARFIARAGSGAATALLEEIGKLTAPSDLLKLLEALPHAMPADMAELAVEQLLRHPAVTVRRRAAGLAAERAFPRAGPLLLDALTPEKDGATRAAMIDALGRVRHAAAADVLMALAEARAEAEEVRVAACLALGHLREPRAADVLMKLHSRGEKGITKVFGSAPPAVRAAATRALGGFPGHREAREMLRQAAMEDRDAGVRAAASQARYAPIYEAFGPAAEGVRLITSADEMPAEDAKFAGSIHEAPLERMFRRIGAAEKTGLLCLSFGGPPARVWFDSGLVVAAEGDGARDHDACVAALLKAEGHFIFQPGVEAAERRMLLPVDRLVEAARARRI